MDWRILNSAGNIKVQGIQGPSGTNGTNGVTGATGATGPPGLSQTLQFSTTGNTVLTSTGYTNLGLSGAISPSSASNRIRIQVGPNIALQYTNAGGNPTAHIRVLRGVSGTTVATFLNCFGTSALTIMSTQPYLDCIDSPATTGATTYVVQGMYTGNAVTHEVNFAGWVVTGTQSYLTLSEIV